MLLNVGAALLEVQWACHNWASFQPGGFSQDPPPWMSLTPYPCCWNVLPVCHSASLQEVRVPYSDLFWWRDPRYGERNAVGQHCFAGTKAEGGKTAYYSWEELERFKGCINLSLVIQQLTWRHTIWAVLSLKNYNSLRVASFERLLPSHN